MNHEEYYEKICKPAFDEILTEIRDMKRRLFVDNGTDSIQSRLNKQERTIGIWCWIVGIIGAAALTGLADVIISRLF